MILGGLSFVHWLVVLSACVSIGGGSLYIRNTLAGKTKPNRVSWFMWALAPLVGTAAAIAAGADVWVSSRIFLAGFIPLLVVAASFLNPQSYWKLTAFDFLCGVCSFIAFIVWVFAGSPRLAILLAALGDALAALPTIRKAWSYPETETGITYIASSISVFLVLPSIPVWNIENSAFQIYLLAVNACLLFSIYRKRIFKRDNAYAHS